MCQPVRLEQYATARGPSFARIVSVQPDREHAFVDVVGVLGDEDVSELRQRVAGLLVAGVRYVLVDLTEAEGDDSAPSAALAAARRELIRRRGWLRLVGSDPSSFTPGVEASLTDVFAMYRAAVGTDAGGRDSRAQ
jgi:anti-anti-sigma regulatory factor